MTLSDYCDKLIRMNLCFVFTHKRLFTAMIVGSVFAVLALIVITVIVTLLIVRFCCARYVRHYAIVYVLCVI